MHKKSQMEIMGLVIVVILIALGMLFAVQFMIKKPGERTTRAVKESALAANFLNTLLSTTTDCNTRNIKELLQDCASFSVIKCGDKSSCQFAKDSIEGILASTLDKWKKNYALTISNGEELSQFSFLRGSCKAEKEVKVHPLPLIAGYELTLRLEICD